MTALIVFSLLLSSASSISNLVHFQGAQAHETAAAVQSASAREYVAGPIPWAPSSQEIAAQDAAMRGAN